MCPLGAKLTHKMCPLGAKLPHKLCPFGSTLLDKMCPFTEKLPLLRPQKCTIQIPLIYKKKLLSWAKYSLVLAGPEGIYILRT